MASTASLTTPVKIVLSETESLYCLLCNSNNKVKRLHCLTKFKASKGNYVQVIEKFTGVELQTDLLGSMHVCEGCINKSTVAISFKQTCMHNINEFNNRPQRQKRMSTTPPSSVKMSVASQIQQSVEKLKCLDLNSTATGPKKSRQRLRFESFDTVKNPVSQADNILSTSEYIMHDTNQSLPFIHDHQEHSYSTSVPTPTAAQCPADGQADHGYSKPQKTSQSEHNTDQTSADEFIKQLCCDVAPLPVIDKSISSVSKFGKSILFAKDPNELCERDWSRDVTMEMFEKCPELFRVLFSAIGDKISAESKLSTMSMIYGMILHCRNVKACAIQRIISALCIRYHADNKLLERLNQIHVTLSHETKRNLLKDFSDYSDFRLIEKVTQGKDGKINGDNLDIYVTTNDIRMDNKNRDYHFFASDFIFDRIKTDNLDDTTSLQNIDEVSWKNFVPSTDEDKLYKESLKVLLGRIMTTYITQFDWVKSILPRHIPHTLDDAMSQKSEICWLPVMLKNEACYSDCIHIMQSYEAQILQWYTKSGRASDLDKLKVPVGGDQLTRVRLQGAKAVQDGALTAEDRLDHLQPIIVEMFHTLQDLMEKLYKRFYKTDSGRDQGTLFNLKLNIERSNINGKVKGRFEAHEDFALTVGNAYFLSYVMDKFGMDTLDAEPKHLLLKTNMKFMRNKNKEDVFNSIMDEIVQELVCTFPQEEPEVILNVEILNNNLVVKSKVDGDLLKFELNINNNNVLFNVTPEQAKHGVTVVICVSNQRINVRISKVEGAGETDDLRNYVMQFLQWYFLILTFKDAIKEGDSERTNMTLKFCIPVFFSHSVLSKYLEECIDYILKTEIILSEKMAMKVKYGSFVNMTGHKGDNKATDLQKENEVLVLKELIRGLGSNKTEKAIITITKAAPVIQDVVNNFDRMTNIHDKHTHHRKRSLEGDVSCILKKLIPLKIWIRTQGRNLENFHQFKKSPFDVDRVKFKEIVMGKVLRLKKGIAIPVESEDESDSENEV